MICAGERSRPKDSVVKEVVDWGGEVPEDTPINQQTEVWNHFSTKPVLDWDAIPLPPDLQPSGNLPSVAAIFGRETAYVCAQIT